MKVLMSVLVLAISSQTWAGLTPAEYSKKLQDEAPAPIQKIEAGDAQKIAKQIRESEKKRTPAQTEAMLKKEGSAEMEAITERFLGAKDSDELDGLLSEMDKNYDSYQNTDAKVFAAHAVPLRSIRGLVWKLRRTFEGNSNAVHSRVLTVAKRIASDHMVFFPVDHVAVVYEYLVSPYFENSKLATDFRDEVDLQIWLSGRVFQSLVKSRERLMALKLDPPVKFDQRLLFGRDSFKYGEFERALSEGAFAAALANIAVIRAYDVRGSISLSKDIGMLYGIDGFLNDVSGVSGKKITEVISSSKYQTLGTLTADGQKWMSEQALIYSRIAIDRTYAAFEASSEARKDEGSFLVNTGIFRVNRDGFGTNLNMLRRIANSTTVEALRSSVTGEVIEIDFNKLYTSPPQDLKLFLPPPKSFDNAKEVSRMAAVDTEGKTRRKVTYRNYKEGRPLKWRTAVYQQYFPSVKTDEDVNRLARVLSHSGGNWLNFVVR
jgi:hypothetical protein